MPKKAKDNEKLKNIEETNILPKPKTTSNKKTSTTKTTNSKKTTIKKEKKTSTTKKNTRTKKTSKKEKKSSSTNKKQLKPTITEYYDLPEKYNQTVVKILAQTPKTLFIYWEISDIDIENYKKQYGDNFFNTTKPVLIIYNDDLNYNFEVEINDFANSWYLHVNDSNSNYRIELGRRPIHNNTEIKSNYIYITSSNKIEAPNDHILFNNSQKMVYYRNIKTNQEIQKPITSLSFMRNMGKIYDIYDIYKELYSSEEDFTNLSNPSS